MGELRTLGLVVVLALLLAVAGCGGSDDDSSPVAEYGTQLTIVRDQNRLYHGGVQSKVKECSVGRRVLLFEQRPGRDRELGANRSGVVPGSSRRKTGLPPNWQFPEKDWAVIPPHSIELHRGARIYAKAPREERSGYVCRADRSKILLHQITNE